METRNENTAAAPVTTLPVDPYSPDNLMLYHVSLGLIEKLVRSGELQSAVKAILPDFE